MDKKTRRGDPVVSETFGNNLKDIIKDSNFVPHTLAAELDIGVHSVWRWQQDKNKSLPPLLTIVDLAAVLNTTPNTLFRGLFDDTHEKAIKEFNLCYFPKNHEIKSYTSRLISQFADNLSGKGLGTRLKLQRTYMGLSTQQVAEALGTKSSRIRDYEYDFSLPQSKNFIKLCNCLHTTPDFLLWDMMVCKPETNHDLYNLLPSTISLFTKALREEP